MIAMFFIALGFLVAATLYIAKKAVIRKAACFKLYKVRDDLVCLVAENKLAEDSRIFQYYYKRSNAWLKSAPNIGLDDALEAILLTKKKATLENALQQARKEATEIANLKEMKDPEVNAVVVDYYNASREMILAHSSLSRLVYLALVRGIITPKFESYLPNPTKNALHVAKFASEEAKLMAKAA